MFAAYQRGFDAPGEHLSGDIWTGHDHEVWTLWSSDLWTQNRDVIGRFDLDCTYGDLGSLKYVLDQIPSLIC